MTVQLDQAPVRYAVMTGEDTEPGRRGNKQLVAQSTVSMDCPDQATYERTMTALRASDEQLRSRPEDEKLYDWQTVFFAPHATEAGAGTLHFGVAWYDRPFFEEKGAAYTNGMHSTMFGRLGVPADSVQVKHWLAA
ncbi:hypothetical protein [Streptomyces sp. Midd1]|uniref:hypothetical protein n=1 Tax=Streptomyces sp. Midd3 TaxID=3161191 RepID=UPI0034DB7372